MVLYQYQYGTNNKFADDETREVATERGRKKVLAGKDMDGYFIEYNSCITDDPQAAEEEQERER